MGLIEIFNNTLELSNENYHEDTERLKENTLIYTEEELHSIASVVKKDNPNILFTRNDTITEIINNKDNGRIAALNFADAVIPGGGVKQGLTTQEECICRCSNLYPSINQERCHKEFYGKNLSNYHNTYRIIYSQDVLVLKDYGYDLLSTSVKCDIITSPAPIEGCATDELILQKMKDIINVAYRNNIDTLILGMWGCGAFGNDVWEFGRLFARAIYEGQCIKNIVFANYTNRASIWDDFYYSFWNEYNDLLKK